MIEAKGLTKTYRKKVAVDNLSFQIETGKVTGFLGPNGAGKSTTMRLMLGLDRGQGTTTYNGRELGSYASPSKIVGVLLESKAFHPTRSARNHLRVLAAAYGIEDKRVDEVLDVVGLQDVAKKGPGKFSLGMSQRLGLAAAILGRPKYLLLDEPANGLDPEGIQWLRGFITDYADQGNAVFISSHLLSELAQMADNVIVIGKGKMITEASLAELTSGSKHAGVFLRSSALSKMERVLRQRLIAFKKSDNGLVVQGMRSDDVGKLAYDAGVPIFELSNRQVSLEDAFLQLTAGETEYHGHVDKSPTNSSKKGAKR